MSHRFLRPYFCFTLLAILSLGLPATGAARSANQSSSASAQDQQFVNKAWNINASEVQLGGVAEQQAASSAVKDFGRRMIADHTKLNQELTQVAQEEGLTLPSTLDKHHQKQIDKLSKLHGKLSSHWPWWPLYRAASQRALNLPISLAAVT